MSQEERETAEVVGPCGRLVIPLAELEQYLSRGFERVPAYRDAEVDFDQVQPIEEADEERPFFTEAD